MSTVSPPRVTSTLKPDLSNWDPENEETWDSHLAWRTLWITTFSMTLGFAAWYLVSAIAPRLNDIGFDLSTSQLYWLVALPGLAGGLLRLVFMFLPPILGTRILVALSSALLLLPMIGWTLVARDVSTPYWVLLALSFAAGIGGGSFSGFMASTSYFFPKRLAGTALGLQAGLGNFGIGLIQLLTPWVVGFGLLGTAVLTPESDSNGELVWLHNGGLVLIPWVLLTVALALIFLRKVPIKANFRQQMDIFTVKHTWIMTLIYLMSFGAFSGLAAQMGLIILNVYGDFPDAPNPLAFAFIGPVLGALVRAACGPLCDRFGGAIFTFIGGAGMAVGTLVTVFFLTPTSVDEFEGFLTGMIIIFFFSGLANAGTFKQMPMIFPKRQAGGAIGWTAAIAAFGPFIVGMALTAMSPTTFFIGCTVFCVLCTGLAWFYYARPGAPNPS
ncbi:NarK/NasA family nitrate transporter [Cryobacterium levicorallinum]|uniref:MFS transporter, NNP family, nitrate/nitrite transporter n=1 Tax=Cryobacterium levicorallinum TaxID=995038 RepID=A0A1I2YH69_9MICO|nr:MFS transporter [Cryobacterium levicorallinum]TFB85958.1 NarK/NasA family nitrate transporter [Cryobacterium levicorallinum]GEP27103.1 nitrate/nitrite transporter [Cryobacterium levicorallinum]SFH24930.1 MFS transporter, NNP family, nitrate/nitrite transporter [Cryobacterium levicorallinum]